MDKRRREPCQRLSGDTRAGLESWSGLLGVYSVVLCVARCIASPGAAVFGDSKECEKEMGAEAVTLLCTVSPPGRPADNCDL